ncbi:unnamed protein product [Microthlaspi erraticum]|uniref:FBD domain-containing protein n=1 Tax=Microthlaspi erraticum TaxID=1685480 RepID=A0A6D2L8Q8_9BRAS|nr:unnamed protein product [Microthlaspi erraticum]
MPKSLYTCKTLARLSPTDKILVDVPFPVSLPSLTRLELSCVVYRDEESHVRLLSGCPVLKDLTVLRSDNVGRVDDNVRKFRVKVPSLLNLTYSFRQVNEDDTDDRSLVIDTPALKYLNIIHGWGGSCSMEYMPHLVYAYICVRFYPDDNLLRSLSSIKYLQLDPPDMVPWCNAVNYSQLIKFSIDDIYADECESLVVLLSNCPQLKVFMVESMYDEIDQLEDQVPVLWNQPSSVPRCLSSRLKLFRWTGYRGREYERELIRYIVENSKCLKKAEVYLNLSSHPEEKQKMAEELKSIPKVLTSVLKPDRRDWW